MDFGAVMSFGAALDVDRHLLASVLPEFERVVVDAICGDEPETEE